MITIVCASCAHALRVTGDAAEVETLVGTQSEYWPNKYRCFKCSKMAEGFLSPEISALAEKNLTMHNVTPQQAFAALNGMGLPSEATCCKEVIEPMFEACGIKVKGHQLPSTTRYVLHELTFPDGRTLYIGSSVAGPMVYRITEKHSYVEDNQELLDVV